MQSEPGFIYFFVLGAPDAVRTLLQKIALNSETWYWGFMDSLFNDPNFAGLAHRIDPEYNLNKGDSVFVFCSDLITIEDFFSVANR
jgi:hypothetical protein